MTNVKTFPFASAEEDGIILFSNGDVISQDEPLKEIVTRINASHDKAVSERVRPLYEALSEVFEDGLKTNTNTWIEKAAKALSDFKEASCEEK